MFVVVFRAFRSRLLQLKRHDLVRVILCICANFAIIIALWPKLHSAKLLREQVN